MSQDMKATHHSAPESIETMNRAIGNAKMIAFNEWGEAAVWSGGPNIYVYNASLRWTMTDKTYLTDVGRANLSEQENYSVVKERMREMGFSVVE